MDRFAASLQVTLSAADFPASKAVATATQDAPRRYEGAFVQSATVAVLTGEAMPEVDGKPLVLLVLEGRMAPDGTPYACTVVAYDARTGDWLFDYGTRGVPSPSP